MIIQHTRDSMTLSNYSEMKGYHYGNESVTLCKRQKKNGFVSSLLAKKSYQVKRSEADKCIGIAHFSQSNMKQLTKTVK